MSTRQEPRIFEHDPASHPKHAPMAHRGHGWMMLVCCVPMLVIAVALVATGVVSLSFLVYALACTGMVFLMMRGMGHGGMGHGNMAQDGGAAGGAAGPYPSDDPRMTGRGDEARVTVRSGYHPDHVRVRVGRPLQLRFARLESGACTAKVVFPDLGISADLPDFGEATLQIPPLAPGEYGFACGMDMVHGMLVVEAAPVSDGAGQHPLGPDGHLRRLR